VWVRDARATDHRIARENRVNRWQHRIAMTTRETVLQYLKAIESNDPHAAEPFLHDDVQNIEHPNKITPNGKTYDRAAMCAAAERGSTVMAAQRYEVRQMIVEGDRAAVTMLWIGTLRDGRSMRAQICSIIELRDGKVWRQEQYDCFE
jgi:ketosteroid isomerase-like protein